MRDDPCLSCKLPECDEASRACAMRHLRASYKAKQRRGEMAAVSPAERAAWNAWHHDWQTARRAEAVEGGRPFRRGGTEYGAARP